MGRTAENVPSVAPSSTTRRGRVVTALWALALAAGLLFVPVTPASGAATCAGLVPDIVGDEGDNVLIGDAGPNVILGLGGDDYIDGGGGDDVICGGAGADEIHGGTGNDYIDGGDNGDTIYGESGDDDLRGYGGYDTIRGGDGDDEIRGHRGHDKLYGQGGNDTLTGGEGNDRLEGNSGGDDLSGDEGDDILVGGKGRDTLRGNDGADTLTGGKYHDKLLGSTGDDSLDGSDGDDELRGGAGADRLIGGQGSDELTGNAGSDLLWGGAGSDVASAGADEDWCNAETETDCENELVDLDIERFLVNQAVPAADSAVSSSQRVATVRARRGIVRAFVALDASGASPPPVVTMQWKNNSGASGTITLNGPGNVPANPQQSTLGDTFNTVFDEGFIKAGTQVYFEVDPNDDIVEIDETNNRFPASGWRTLGATSVPRFDITFVPITLNGVTPPMDEASGLAVLDHTIRMHPVAGVDVEIHAPYVFNGDQQSDWGLLLQELAALQASDGSDRFYYGILPTGITPGIGGIAYIGWPIALGLESSPIAAHELGHNFNLMHAPCGGPAGADPDYPYAGGLIGSWGYDVGTGQLLDPTTHKDLMGYCSPEWISDYNYENVLDYRKAVGAGLAAAPARGDGVVMISGSIEGAIDQVGPGQDLTLADAGASRATINSIAEVGYVMRGQTGAFTLAGYDDTGNQLFATPFTPAQVADGPAITEGSLHFIVTVALDGGEAALLSQLTVLYDGDPVAVVEGSIIAGR